MIVKLLTEHHLKFQGFKGGCTGSSESTLVKMPHCWKSHVTAQNFTFFQKKSFTITIRVGQLGEDAKKTVLKEGYECLLNV